MRNDDDNDGYEPHDLDALQRAMERARKRDKVRAQQIDAKLLDEAWGDVAEFAAYGCQIEALGLRPWEDPPMYGDIKNAQPAAAALLAKMLAAGVSRYEPNPMKALCERRKRRHDA
jgi:hypothetical protein